MNLKKSVSEMKLIYQTNLSVLILFQNHPQNLAFQISEDGSEIELKHCASSKTSGKSSRKYFVHLNWIRRATIPS